MPHVALLGDSIFDNGAYTGGGPDVISQLRPLLPGGWGATLLAVDGARTNDVMGQVSRVRPDTSHLVLSVGGNDALAHGDLLDRPAASSAQVIGYLADAAADFARRYRALMELLLARKFPLTVCTIYDGHFPDPEFQRIASAALCVFNDVILRLAFTHRVTVIDLRLVCTQTADYANPIEPSSVGGSKIARAIVQALSAGDQPSYGPQVIGGGR